MLGVWGLGFLWSLVFGAWCFVCFAAPIKIDLPMETAVFRYDTGSEIANGQCLVCHSVEYISTQPKKDRVFWAASVKKMQDKYGAPIPADQVEPLLDYLTKNYGVVGMNVPSANVAAQAPAETTSSATFTTTSAPTDAPKIATKYGCLACHNVRTTVVGPAYREIAAKYKSDSEASAKIEGQIQKGGSGKWGPVIMPPFPQIPGAERKILIEWILSQK